MNQKFIENIQSQNEQFLYAVRQRLLRLQETYMQIHKQLITDSLIIELEMIYIDLCNDIKILIYNAKKNAENIIEQYRSHEISVSDEELFCQYDNNLIAILERFEKVYLSNWEIFDKKKDKLLGENMDILMDFFDVKDYDDQSHKGEL